MKIDVQVQQASIARPDRYPPLDILQAGALAGHADVRVATHPAIVTDSWEPGDKTSAIYTFLTRVEAEAAIRVLSRSGFEMKNLSLIGKGYQSEKHAVGTYTNGARVKSWGRNGAFWGGVSGLLLAPAVFFLPGIGVIALAGPVVSALVGALEGAVVGGGMSALGAALSRIGVAKSTVAVYETALTADTYVLMMHGNAEEIGMAHAMLVDRSNNWLQKCLLF